MRFSRCEWAEWCSGLRIHRHCQWPKIAKVCLLTGRNMFSVLRSSTDLLVATLLVLFAGQISAQEARKDAKAVIREIHFFGDDELARANQSKFDSLELENRAEFAAIEELEQRVQYLYQCNGHFKAEVKAYPHPLTRDSDEQPLSVDVQIVQNLQYRLRRLEFTGQKVFSAEQLRPLFPIQDGEVFNVEKIREGLDKLRRVYDERGYINFTPVPETEANDAQAVIDLTIDIDEGAQSRIGTISFSGEAASDSNFQERVLKSLGLKPGDVYDPRLLEAFFKASHSWLPVGSTIENSLEIAQNTRRGTVDLYFVFEER
jgi:outer membrane protein assembly factor BamA